MTPRFLAPALRRRSLLTVLALAAVAPALPRAAQAAQAATPEFELVHNAPAGTTLATPALPDAGTVWRTMIAKARHDIAIEQFYVSGKPGEALDPILDALETAARRGVHIRFLMDAKGLRASNPETLARLKAIPGLEYRLIDWSKLGGSGIIHAKFIVVDGTKSHGSAYLGSQNFDWRSLSQIDETGVLVHAPRVVKQMQAIFEHDWDAQALVAADKPVPALPHDTGADDRNAGFKSYLVASPPAYLPKGVGASEPELVRLIDSARMSIRVEVMEYSTTRFGGGEYRVIDDALRRAAARGVKVQLIVADWDLTERRLPGLDSLAQVPGVEIRVSRIPEAASGYIPYARVVHSKTMTIDGTSAWVGTSNWEGGYFDDSRNLEMVFHDPAMTRRVAALQDQLWNSDYALPYAKARELPPVRHGD